MIDKIMPSKDGDESILKSMETFILIGVGIISGLIILVILSLLVKYVTM